MTSLQHFNLLLFIEFDLFMCVFEDHITTKLLKFSLKSKYIQVFKHKILFFAFENDILLYLHGTTFLAPDYM